jgi:hypothetical protein
LDAGATMRDERWYWDGDFPETIEQPCHRRLVQAAHEVPSLVHIVRDSLRRFMGARTRFIVPELDIPSTLKDTLLLRDVLGDNV